MAHRPVHVPDVEESDLAFVDRGERMRDERVEAGIVDLDVEDPSTSGRHCHGLHAVERIVRAHVSERVGGVEDRSDDMEVGVEGGPRLDRKSVV